MNVRNAPFALRVVRRRAGEAAILYRRSLNRQFQERLTKVASIGPLAFVAGGPLLRSAVRATQGAATKLTPGPFYPLDPDWGARVACYALVASGLRNGNRLHHAAANLQHADATEAAWWFGLMVNGRGNRAIRALRILVEAVR
jgi:hypothetical protein